MSTENIAVPELAQEFDEFVIEVSHRVDGFLTKGKATGIPPGEAIGEGRCLFLQAMILLFGEPTCLMAVQLLILAESTGMLDNNPDGSMN